MSSSDDATREDIMIITWQNSGNAFVHEMPDGLIDIQQKCRNKVWRSRKYTESPEKRQTVCEIVWYSAPTLLAPHPGSRHSREFVVGYCHSGDESLFADKCSVA